MKKSVLFFGLFFLLISCGSSDGFDQFDDDFEENRWQENDAKTYEFTIDDDTTLYNITLRFSHIFDYQFISVPINFAITNPNGEEQKKQIDLQIKDSSGKELAECSGDFCDLKYLIEEKVKLQKGNYKIIISHSFEGPYLPNVLGVGIKVEPDKEIKSVLGVKI